MKTQTATEQNFFYFISQRVFLICDLQFCAKSERTFDISLFELANNKELLNKLNLYYMSGNYGVTYDYYSRAKWFCGYLSAFYSPDKGQYEKSITNPVVRLLIEDESLYAEVKKILSKSENK